MQRRRSMSLTETVQQRHPPISPHIASSPELALMSPRQQKILAAGVKTTSPVFTFDPASSMASRGSEDSGVESKLRQMKRNRGYSDAAPLSKKAPEAVCITSQLNTVLFISACFSHICALFLSNTELSKSINSSELE